ncbi:MAG TPA: iron chelate uptake ABC transporter family permease subunit [Terriglobia bacterium]|nr:iron chelate uptake ABC transporter family permease subunit [Terriglobia bacterium]
MLSSPTKSLVVLSAITVAVALGAVFLGPVGLPDAYILLNVRAPRVLLGFLVGCGLAGAGAVFQGVLRNPLADPFILGTSSAATVGVMLANLLGWRNYYALYFMALGCALASIALVYRIAQTNGKTPIQTMVLGGVIVSLFLNALVFVFFSIFYRESFTVLFYLLGTLTSGDLKLISISGVIIVVGFSVSWMLSRELNALTQGEETAFHLGIEVESVKKILFAAASAMTAASVAVAGMIGFVGLVVPHLMRMIVGPDHRYLIPAATLGGASVLILTDAAARTLVPPLEIPVGALTALLGAPYFLYLLQRKKSAGEF